MTVPMTVSMTAPLLFSRIVLGQLTLQNRVIISPMCQYSAVNGNASDWHAVHFGRMLASGAGMFIIEATAVELAGRISPACLSLASDENEAALARVLKIARAHAHAHSTMPIAIQLAHAGRKASTAIPWVGTGQVSLAQGGWISYGPSALPFDGAYSAPIAMDKNDIARVRTAFVDAAKRAVNLGFDAIEVHAAHGYLLHQFLSPFTNQRTDEYGGSLENRMRLTREVFDAVRAAVPHKIPVGVRISASDWIDGTWDVTQSIELVKVLQSSGCAWVDTSSGGLSLTQKITLGPGYQVPFSAAIKAATAVPTMAVGLIESAEQAQTIVQEGRADMVALGRAFLWNAAWVWHAAKTLGATIPIPPQYVRGVPN